MSSKQEEQQARESRSLEAVVGENVMHDLGQPAGLHHVQARRVFGGNYRVNVFVGADADGKVIESSPAITRRY